MFFIKEIGSNKQIIFCSLKANKITAHCLFCSPEALFEIYPSPTGGLIFVE